MAPRLAPQDDTYMRVRKELFNKEIATQCVWFERFGRALIEEHLDVLRVKKTDLQKKMEAMSAKQAVGKLVGTPKRPRTTTSPVSPAHPRLITVAQTKKQMEDLAESIVDQSPCQPPVSVNPAIRALLYNGLSYEGEGRAAYLQARNEDPPNARYNYIPLTMWLHGWWQDEFPTERLPMSDVPRPHCLKHVFRKNVAFPNTNDVAWRTGEQTRQKV